MHYIGDDDSDRVGSLCGIQSLRENSPSNFWSTISPLNVHFIFSTLFKWTNDIRTDRSLVSFIFAEEFML